MSSSITTSPTSYINSTPPGEPNPSFAGAPLATPEEISEQNYQIIMEHRKESHMIWEKDIDGAGAQTALDYYAPLLGQYAGNAEVTLEIWMQQLFYSGLAEKIPEAEALTIKIIRHYFDAKSQGQEASVPYMTFGDESLLEIVTKKLDLIYSRQSRENKKNAAEFIAQEFPVVREKSLWKKLMDIVTPAAINKSAQKERV